MRKRPSLRDLFIPHAGNDYAPHILQRAAMIMMLGLIIATFTVANLHSLFWLTSDWLVSTILPSVIVDLTNVERNDNGAGQLTRNATLDAAAQLKANDMAKNSYFAHYSPTGVSPWYWFDEAGYVYSHAGENLAVHFTDSDQVVEAWMKSPSHRANIVDEGFTEIGVGTARGKYEGYDTVFVVQLFGTPAAAAAPASTVVVAQSTQTQESSPVLAETIEITPVAEPTPEPIAESEPEPVVVAVAPDTTEAPAETETAAEDSTIKEVEVRDDTVSVYSDTVATTSGRAEAPPSVPTEITKTGGGSIVGSLATRPNMVLESLYLMIGLFVLAALALSIFIEIRRQQPLQIAYSLALILLMSGLFYIHAYITAGALIV